MKDGQLDEIDRQILRTLSRDGQGELVVTPARGVDRRIDGLEKSCPSHHRPHKAVVQRSPRAGRVPGPPAAAR